MLPQQLKRASSKKSENCIFLLPQSKSSITWCGSTLTQTSKHQLLLAEARQEEAPCGSETFEFAFLEVLVKAGDSTALFGSMYICTCKYLYAIWSILKLILYRKEMSYTPYVSSEV